MLTFPHLGHQAFPAGVYLGVGTVLPPGGNVHYVRSSGRQDGDPPDLAGRLHTTLNSALGQCRASLGDNVVLLPGHTETISAADQMSSLVAGTRIIGLGEPYSDQRPTLNWTAATSTFLFDVAGTTLSNCILNMNATAATVVAAPITVTAAGCKITGCKVHVATSNTQLATVPFTVDTNGSDFFFSGNDVWTTGAGTFATNPTYHLKIAATVRNIKIIGNDFFGGTAAGTGLIEATAAPTNVRIIGNYMQNMFATSTSCLVLIAATTGIVAYNSWAVGNDGVSSAQGLTVPGNVRCFQNFSADEAGKSGLLSPVVVTN